MVLVPVPPTICTRYQGLLFLSPCAFREFENHMALLVCLRLIDETEQKYERVSFMVVEGFESPGMQQDESGSERGSNSEKFEWSEWWDTGQLAEITIV